MFATPPPIRIIESLIVPVERPIGDNDPLKPFDRRHRIPAGNNRAQWKTVLRQKLFAVHSVGKKDIVECFRERNASSEMNLTRGSLVRGNLTSVCALQNHLECAPLWFRAF